MVKIKYEFNPYTFARISAMKSLLYKVSDYDKIFKMDTAEIIKFMQDGIYSNEINALAVRYKGIRLVEKALNLHLSKVFEKLKRISDDNIVALMNQYLKRYDYHNVKTLLRGKLTNVAEPEIMDMLMPGGGISYERLRNSYSQSVKHVLELVVDVSEFKQILAEYETSKNLSEIENKLDFEYYIDSVKFADLIPEEGKLFKEFFKYELDIYNIKLILKKIHFRFDKEIIMRFLIPKGRDIKTEQIKKLVECDSFSAVQKELSRTSYKSIFQFDAKEENVYLKSEVMLDSFLLQKSILLYHQNPLSVDLVLGFMFAEEIQARNLRTIVKSKSLAFTEKFVEKLIVVKNG